jgi:hypothetical protein
MLRMNFLHSPISASAFFAASGLGFEVARRSWPLASGSDRCARQERGKQAAQHRAERRLVRS